MEVLALMAAHKLVPVVDKTFAVADAAEAYTHLAEGGKHFGKVMMTAD